MRLLLVMSLFLGSNLLAQDSKTSIGFSLNPNFSSVMYQSGGSFSDADVELIKSKTHGKIGLSGNVFFQYALKEKLLITWGIGIQNYGSRTSYYSQSVIEHPTITRETTYNQYYIGFSTSLKYRFFKSAYARTGFGVDLLAEQRAKRTETCPTCEYSYQGEDNSGIYKEALIPLTIGLGYEFKLNEEWNLMTELYGSMSLSDAFLTTTFTDQVQLIPDALLKPHLQQRPFQLGAKVGVIRSF